MKNYKQITRIVVTVILLMVLSCPAVSLADDALKAALPQEAKVSERILGLPGLENVGRVAPGIFRGAQPTDEGFKTLKSMGIKTVINLRNKHNEKQAVEALGMKSIEIPFDMFSTPQEDKVDKVIALLSDPENHPLYLHCALGEDRTGTIIAIYRMKVDNWPLSQAEEEMQAFGFNDIWIHLMKYVRKYPDGIK